MAQQPSDPWHIPAPPANATPEQRLRYARAVRLSLFKAGRGSRDAAYRQHCLTHWQAYLDGEINPPTGSKPKR